MNNTDMNGSDNNSSDMKDSQSEINKEEIESETDPDTETNSASPSRVFILRPVATSLLMVAIFFQDCLPFNCCQYRHCQK